MDDLLSEFISETRETLEALGCEIVAWEAAPEDRARLDAIFRFVHTVKGSCGFLDLPRLEKLSHAAEDVLADVRAGRRTPDPRLVSAVLGVIDRIGELSEAMETGAAVPHQEDAVLIAALSAVAEPALQPAAPVAAVSSTSRPMARSIRLPVELLDRMMGGVSDLVLARNELARKMRHGQGDAAAEAAFDRLSHSIGEMRDAITRTRMARIDNLFSALPRLVRDLSADLAKLVQLEIDGSDVELDREMIEMIRDPLTHIVRNAIDHGIEGTEARAAAGKPATGRLRVSARQSGNRILIEVADDGRGIDPDRLVAKAIAQGMLTADRAAAMSVKARLELIFAAGFSTAETVTAISGRGVGMDVVRANVERIGGTVELDSRLGQGLRLTLSVPLTLTIIPALTIGVGELHYAIPRSVIEEIVRVGGRSVAMERMGDASVALIRGRRLPVVPLDRFLDIGSSATEGEPQVLVVVRAGGGERYALGVDRVFDHEELVVKPAAPAIMAAGIFAGTTLPDNSRPMLLLDVASIAQIAGVRPLASDGDNMEIVASAAEAAPTLLFLDLDGFERAIRLALVERIEDVPAAAIGHAAGRLRLTQGGQILSLVSCGAPLPDDRVRILRLSDGFGQIGYAIDRVIDIVPISAQITPAATPGPIAGVLPFDGRAIEMLDAYWLFAESGLASEPTPVVAEIADSRPLCLLADAGDPWTRQVLGPLVAAAGYRIRYADDCNDEMPADVVIAGSAVLPPKGMGAPVVRLRHQPVADADGSIYRYDRTGLLDALKSSVGGRG